MRAELPSLPNGYVRAEADIDALTQASSPDEESAIASTLSEHLLFFPELAGRLTDWQRGILQRGAFEVENESGDRSAA